MRIGSHTVPQVYSGATWSVDFSFPPAARSEPLGFLVVSDAQSGTIIDVRVKRGEFTIVDVIELLCRLMVEHGRPDAISTEISVLLQSRTLTQWCIGIGIDRVFRAPAGSRKREVMTVARSRAIRGSERSTIVRKAKKTRS